VYPVSACSIWIGDLTDMAQDSDPKTRASSVLPKERYFADKQNGITKQYWSGGKLEQEAERSQKEARIQTHITVNRTTARVMKSVERTPVTILRSSTTLSFHISYFSLQSTLS